MPIAERRSQVFKAFKKLHTNVQIPQKATKLKPLTGPQK